MSEERSGKWYYYANERGCLKHTDSLDEAGIGFDGKRMSCSLTIRLMDLSRGGLDRPRFSMAVVVHCDEWRSFDVCAAVFTMLSKSGIPAGEMKVEQPFYDLRAKIEKLGYKNLGALKG